MAPFWERSQWHVAPPTKLVVAPPTKLVVAPGAFPKRV